ncbi:MAG: LPS-assembly protein LptD [Sedimentisphaerales bacterium]|nr:LPS-assembly protein LptD [Sedimentisphaerales bacterium]
MKAMMRLKWSYIFVLACVLCRPSLLAAEAEQVEAVEAFAGQDLHVKGPAVMVHRLAGGSHVLVFNGGLSMSIGDNQLSAGSGVVWLDRVAPEYTGQNRGVYTAMAYLRGGVNVRKGTVALTTDLRQIPVAGGQAQVVWFSVSGEVLVSADKRDVGDPQELELYKSAVDGMQEAGIASHIVGYAPKPEPVKPEPVEPGIVKPGPVKPDVEKPEEPKFRYPVNISPAGEVNPKLASAKSPDGTDIATVIGRFYLWQKQDEKGGLLELQADYAVIFYSTDLLDPNNDKTATEDLLAMGAVKGIYLSGDVLMTSGQRTIRADELYYDFEQKRAIVKNAEMRNFNAKEGIPIYVRAKEMRQVAENKFTAEDVTVTTSEFHKPQLSLDVRSISITDTTTADEQQKGSAGKNSYDAEMDDVRFNVYDTTILHLPHMRSNLERPDTPLKSAHIGHGSRWGYLAETRWYLARLLGLEEPEGTESTLAVDYYSKRGVGVGIEVEYARENYFGNMLGYIIDDRGEDRLGRHTTRKNLDPNRDLRGRFLWQHRQFLANNWQLTSEISYSSDMNFLESYYRSEFNVGKEQETLLHLKRIQDNWGLSFLTKVRINDFVNKLEEVPTGEFHWTGQSFFNDRLTFYSDTQVSRFRQRYASSTVLPGPEQFFTFMTTRNEVDMPLTLGKLKVVPFVAGTMAYEDRMGFYREIDGGTGRREDDVFYGETGVRISRQPYWKVFPNARSRLLDVDQLRHVVRPHLTAVSYTQNESVIEQRDILNVGLSQRLQTKRGVGDRRRTVDWMRLNTDVTFVNDSGGASAGADQFIWNKPFIPMVNTYSSSVPQLDRRSSSMYGVRRNYFGADYSWRLSDTTALLSDMNYDMQSGVVQQFNIGFSRMRWPDLSYYVGSRYLRRITVNDPTSGLKLQEGSNAFVFAITYVLDPRYSVVFSQQIDFDYGATIGSEISLIRRYHRMYWGLTFMTDESLNEQGIVLSVWPQGVSDLSVGPRRYMKMGGSTGGY